ncbi:hypothetical protein ACIBPB_25190 [Micromonospora sp. NPDC049836]|uniref:hypothetical protein n=1 Tax=Micromonospora sp. NPDC049836 TaxID=3364274 RepID=UPI00379C0D30
MGYDSPQAASIYQHATADADRGIAQALHEAVRVDRKKTKKRAKTKGKTMDSWIIRFWTRNPDGMGGRQDDQQSTTGTDHDSQEEPPEQPAGP